MKTFRSFSTVLSVCLLLFLAAGCSSDDDDDKPTIGNPAGKLLSKIETSGDWGTYSMRYTYDEKLLTSIEGSDGDRTTLSYSDNYGKVTITDNDYSGTSTLNKRGYIETFDYGESSAEFIYNSNGYMASEAYEWEEYTDVIAGEKTIYTYKNGNRISASATGYAKIGDKTLEDNYKITYTYTYSDKENKSKINIFDDEVNDHIYFRTPSGLFGKAPKNLIEKLEIKAEDKDSVYKNEIIEFRYSYDSDGYVTKIVITEEDLIANEIESSTLVIAY